MYVVSFLVVSCHVVELHLNVLALALSWVALRKRPPCAVELLDAYHPSCIMHSSCFCRGKLWLITWGFHVSGAWAIPASVHMAATRCLGDSLCEYRVG